MAGRISKRARIGAVRKGAEQFRQMLQAVDFPAFVSGLIQGVFEAAVGVMIKQVQAYLRLVSAMAKTPDARIANRHPSAVRRRRGGSRPRARHPRRRR